MGSPKPIEDFVDQIHRGKWELVLPQIPSDSIDIVVTSPPYNVNLGNNKKKKDSYDSYDDNMPYEDYLNWMDKLFAECHRILKSGGRICVNIGDGSNGSVPTHADFMIRMRDKLGFIPMTTIVWDKKQIGASCLLPCELINTMDGYKKICDIKENDFVLTHKRRFKKVIRVFERNYTGYLYKIKSNFNEEIIVTEGHPLLLSPLHRKCGKYSPKRCVSRDNIYWESPEKIKGENYLVCPRYKTQYHSTVKNFNKRMASITGVEINYYDEDFFRLLGYYIGDGSVHRKEVRVDFGLTEKDISSAHDVETICCKYGWKFHFEKRTNLKRIVIASNNVLPKIMESLGGKYARNKFIHPFLFQLPFCLQKHLLYGLFFSDGCIRKDFSEAVYTTISEKLAYQIRDILLRLKIGSSIDTNPPCISYIKGRKVFCKKVYRVRILGRHVSKLLKELKVPENHNFKYRCSKMKVGSYHGFYRIRNIEKEWVNNIKVYNMEVEDDNSYVGKIAYHNCAWGSYQSPSQPSFPTQFEFIIVMAKDTKKHEGDKSKISVGGKEFQRNSRALWSFPPETRMMELYDHPAMYPEELPKRLIQQLTYEDDIVLDPFSGIATTCVAAKKLNRRYIGIEMSEQYHERSLRRLRETSIIKRVVDEKTKKVTSVVDWM